MTRGSVALLAGALALASPAALRAQRFVVSDSTVRQGRFEARALGRDTIVSSYPRAAREVRFRFSINGLENEFPGGTEHTIYLRPRGGRLTTALYTFGVEDAPAPPTPEESASSEEGVAQVTFRVDLRQVVGSLRERGFYQPPLGARIGRGALEHVYVLGDPAPLTWDYAALRPGSPLELRDADGDGIYEGTVPIQTEYARPTTADGRAIWARHLDLTAYPMLASSQRIQDATYRLSLEELRQLVREDGALSAGAKWPGVWTRDVSLSAMLSLAIVAPDAVKRSLLAKVDSSGRIIQDTGTGGSWPISSDRMVWSLAAWEVYAVTGDRAWLRQSYDIIARSAGADLHAVRDREIGLFRGESSFMDWREQSYPRWMQPADIYPSFSLATNAVHFGAYRILARMATALGERPERWERNGAGVQRGLNARLWDDTRGWYGQYLYGRVYPSRSPRSDGLGEALAIVTGASDAEHRATLVRRTPLTEFGVPSFWPFIPGERFYHNATVWPFVTAYWTWAAADAGNTVAVQRGLDDATRTTALFLTNKENFVSLTGHYDGTALNSDRQLWSVAGTLASTYRILFGMRFEPDRLELHPMVPPAYAGVRTLTGVRYRDAMLTITVRGSGDAVSVMRIDGRLMGRAEVPATLTGAHVIDVTMNGKWPASAVNVVESRFAPATPKPVIAGNALAWPRVPGATRYVVYQSGVAGRPVVDTSVTVHPEAELAEYQVLALNGAGDQSFLSEPVRVILPGAERLAKPEGAPLEHVETGFTGAGYVRAERDRNTAITFQVRTGRPRSRFALDVRYANGNGPVNTEDKAAVRTVLVDGDTAGVLVMPQRGAGRWSEWGWSNALLLDLAPGDHHVTLVYTALDANMNLHENTALVDQLRLTPVATRTAARTPARTRTRTRTPRRP